MGGSPEPAQTVPDRGKGRKGTMGEESIAMQSPTEPSWIAELANQERERRKEHQIVRIAAGEFRELLSEQIMSDLYTYLHCCPRQTEI